jgi:hypothetical protein
MFLFVIATSVDRMCVWVRECENFILYSQQYARVKCVHVFTAPLELVTVGAYAYRPQIMERNLSQWLVCRAIQEMSYCNSRICEQMTDKSWLRNPSNRVLCLILF